MPPDPSASPSPEDGEAVEVEPVPGPDEIAEELQAVEGGEEDRRYPSTIGGVFYLLIMAFCAIGLVIVWLGDWRLGIRCLAGGLCFAATLRLALPRRDAGMLAVRNRFFDAFLLGGVGAALFFLAATIPDQPGS